MAIQRYALTAKDGTIVNIVACDPLDVEKGGKGFTDRVAANGYALVPLKDGADDMGKINVEPGDKCTDVVKGTFQKGVLGTTPVDLSKDPVIAVDPVVDPEPVADPVTKG